MLGVKPSCETAQTSLLYMSGDQSDHPAYRKPESKSNTTNHHQPPMSPRCLMQLALRCVRQVFADAAAVGSDDALQHVPSQLGHVAARKQMDDTGAEHFAEARGDPAAIPGGSVEISALLGGPRRFCARSIFCPCHTFAFQRRATIE